VVFFHGFVFPNKFSIKLFNWSEAQKSAHAVYKEEAICTSDINLEECKKHLKNLTDFNCWRLITWLKVFNTNKNYIGGFQWKQIFFDIFPRSSNVGPMDLRISTEIGKIIGRVLEIKATNFGLVMYCIASERT